MLLARRALLLRRVVSLATKTTVTASRRERGAWGAARRRSRSALRTLARAAEVASGGGARGDHPPPPPWQRFCGACGAPTESRVPDGDDRPRAICTAGECGRIHYFNPRMVVGAIVRGETEDGREGVLLCKRAIEPCRCVLGAAGGLLGLVGPW